MKLVALALTLFTVHVVAQSTSGNWTVPTSLNEYRIDDKTSKTFGSHVDVNDDGLPDIVVGVNDDGGVGIEFVCLATYLNTGKGYCIASENDSAKIHREQAGSSIPFCSDIPSMTMHDPKEDALTTDFLTSIGLGEYSPAFAEHKVEYTLLREMEDADLKEIGVRAWGARRKILNAIKGSTQN